MTPEELRNKLDYLRTSERGHQDRTVYEVLEWLAERVQAAERGGFSLAEYERYRVTGDATAAASPPSLKPGELQYRGLALQMEQDAARLEDDLK
jgi:hypothetical protein